MLLCTVVTRSSQLIELIRGTGAVSGLGMCFELYVEEYDKLQIQFNGCFYSYINHVLE